MKDGRPHCSPAPPHRGFCGESSTVSTVMGYLVGESEGITCNYKSGIKVLRLFCRDLNLIVGLSRYVPHPLQGRTSDCTCH